MARQTGFAALTGAMFAATMLIMVGVFEIIAGITAIFRNQFFVTVRNYTFNLDTTAWGWIHLALGALLVITGVALMSGRTWAAVTGLVLAALSAINNFFFLPYYPLWAIVVIAVDVFVIWSLATMLGATSAARDGEMPPAATGRTQSGRSDVKTPRPAGAEQSTRQEPPVTRG
ncbi:DUF7144 family membrane protein [Actinocatenispora sera]|uniref:DUF7144 domain-containing protein n=1 Tax=Actinocatenispora sera TaxID=390989 RepID=A0A810L0A9_9ACTN|nr:hypothetical protein [Actinocatenispora sera]BCJ28345.1 hypothetical protein Asera_24530 [Actinocatenispora sera]